MRTEAIATVLAAITIATAMTTPDANAVAESGRQLHLTREMTTPAPVTTEPLETTGPATTVTLIGSGDEQAALVDELHDRFAAAGLELPPLTITFMDDSSECGGHSGLYEESSRSIVICQFSEFILAHELAHAWAAHNLTDADREAYRQQWDAPTWRSHEYPWEQRATERAANTIAWALLLDDPHPNAMFRTHLCTYERLTGNSLPHELAVPC